MFDCGCVTVYHVAFGSRLIMFAVEGLERGYYQITNDLLTDILRVASRGNAPWNNILWDWCLLGISAVCSCDRCSEGVLILLWQVGVPVWRWIIDYQVKGHRAVHAERLKASGMSGVHS